MSSAPRTQEPVCPAEAAVGPAGLVRESRPPRGGERGDSLGRQRVTGQRAGRRTEVAPLRTKQEVTTSKGGKKFVLSAGGAVEPHTFQ